MPSDYIQSAYEHFLKCQEEILATFPFARNKPIYFTPTQLETNEVAYWLGRYLGTFSRLKNILQESMPVFQTLGSLYDEAKQLI